MNYNFYVSEQFSRCGVDAMQLVKIEGKWRVIQLMDTRRTVGCRTEND